MSRAEGGEGDGVETRASRRVSRRVSRRDLREKNTRESVSSGSYQSYNCTERCAGDLTTSASALGDNDPHKNDDGIVFTATVSLLGPFPSLLTRCLVTLPPHLSLSLAFSVFFLDRFSCSKKWDKADCEFLCASFTGWRIIDRSIAR